MTCEQSREYDPYRALARLSFLPSSEEPSFMTEERVNGISRLQFRIVPHIRYHGAAYILKGSLCQDPSQPSIVTVDGIAGVLDSEALSFLKCCAQWQRGNHTNRLWQHNLSFSPASDVDYCEELISKMPTSPYGYLMRAVEIHHFGQEAIPLPHRFHASIPAAASA